MGRYILLRFAQGAMSLLAVSVIVFGVVHLTGDPVSILLPETASAEQYENLRRELGLDRALPLQYAAFLSRILTGDLGESVRAGRPVSELVYSRLPATLELGAAAIVITLVVGVPLGLYAGYWHNSLFDKIARGFAVLGQSAPPFWVGIVFIWIVAVNWGWLRAGGRGTWRHLALPSVTMAWASMAGVTRLMRSSILETLETDYIRLCRIKGLSESAVLWKHGLRNAGLPVLTFSAVIAGSLITGSVVIETVFAWPGLGKLLIDSITFRDLPTVQVTVLLFATVYILLNLAVDILYAYLNPRLRAQ